MLRYLWWLVHCLNNSKTLHHSADRVASWQLASALEVCQAVSIAVP